MTAIELRRMLVSLCDDDDEVMLFMGPPYWTGPINRIARGPKRGVIELQCLIGPTPCPDRQPEPVEPMGMLVGIVPIRDETNRSMLNREKVSGEMERMRRERDEARAVARRYWNAVDQWKPDAFDHSPCPAPHWLEKY